VKCSHCGEPASSHEVDQAFGLPDAVFALKGAERTRRAQGSSDMYMLDKKWFYIRGVVFLPIKDAERKFGIGFWAEVNRDVVVWYADHYSEDMSSSPQSKGRLANSFAAMGRTMELLVTISWGDKGSRPTFLVEEGGIPYTSQLYKEQRDGITMARVHELLALPS